MIYEEKKHIAHKAEHFDVLELNYNKLNSKYLISVFYDSKPSEEFMKSFNENLHDIEIEDTNVNSCVNMLLASDYFSIICSYNISFYDVFSNLLKTDERIRILISYDLSTNSDFNKLWLKNGSSVDSLETRVSYVRDNYVPPDNDYIVYCLGLKNKRHIPCCDRICEIVTDVTGKTKTDVAKNLIQSYGIMIMDNVDYENINLNWYFRHVGIFINI